MALLKYLRPEPSHRIVDPHGPLSAVVPSSVLNEVHKELKSSTTEKKKRGPYLSFTPEEKAKVAEYVSTHGVRAALRHYNQKNGKELKENTVRDWVKAYKKELHSKRKLMVAENDSELAAVTALPERKRDRPLLVGNKVDAEIQTIVKGVHDSGAVINTAIVTGIAKGVLDKRDMSLLSENGGPIDPGKNLAKSLLYRMGFVKRRGNTKAKVTVDHCDELKTQFLFDINATVKMQEIPSDLIINWDQTGIKIVPVSSWTMEQKGAKRVEVAGIDDKRQITAVFAATATGEFLPMPLIYAGKTPKCLPKFPFPKDWIITFTENRWSNEETMKDYNVKIIVPYVKKKREELKLADDHPALVLFDIFKGQCTDDVLKLLMDNNIEYIIVPANCTDRLQPLDVSVNKPAKEFLQNKFQGRFADQIASKLESNDKTSVDTRLSIMKPLGVGWLVELYDHLCSNPSFIVNGFRASGILKSIQ